MSGLALDLRFALRALARRPGFTAVALVILAVALGATTAVFSLVWGVLLQPLALPEPERVVAIFEDHQARGGSPREVTGVSTTVDLREGTRSFEAVAASLNTDALRVALATGQGAEAVTAGVVTPGYFDVLGVAPAVGRSFLPAEEVEGDDGVVLLSHGLWQRAFGGRDGVLGEAIQVGGRARTVVGILPRGLVDPLVPQADLWYPLARVPGEDDYGGYYVRAVGRLRPGVTVERATADVASVVAGLRERHPDVYRDVGAAVVPLHEVVVGNVRTPLVALFAAVLLVLLIACVNLANLLLARAAGREREIAVRAALGAGRGRLVRQLVTESLLLAVAGGVLGVLAGGEMLRFLVRLAPPGTPRLAEARLEAPVFLFAFAATLAVGLLFGLLPAWRASRPQLASPLRGGARTVAGGARLRGGLIVAEVALSLALLVGAGLLVRSLLALGDVDPGFATESLLTAQVSFPAEAYPEASDVLRGLTAIEDALRATPGVAAVGATSVLPLTNMVTDAGVEVEGRPRRDDDPLYVQYHAVTPTAWDGLGIPFLAGRRFGLGDDAEAPKVVAINDAFARHYFPDRDPLGQRVLLGSSGTPRTIVGVVGSVRHVGLAASAAPQVYLPHAQVTARSMALVVQAAGEPSRLAGAVEGIVRRLDPAMPVMSVQTGKELVRGELAMPRFLASILGAFAGVALFLAAVGLYGLMAYLVAERRRDIGLRLALGARPASVLAMIVRQGLALAAAGAALGVALAVALSRGLEALLYDVRPADPWTFAAAAALLLAAALAACLGPGLRAARVDPAVSLRDQ